MLREAARLVFTVPLAVVGAVALVFVPLGVVAMVARAATLLAPVPVAVLCGVGLCVPVLMSLCAGAIASAIILAGTAYDRGYLSFWVEP